MYMKQNDFYKKYGNLYLTDEQVNTLKKYNIDFNKYNKLSDLIYYIEYTLNGNNLEDLEKVSEELSEFQYYNYTNK